MLYGKAGVAFGSFRYTETHDDFACPGSFCSVSFTETRTGFLLGAGWEYAFANNWTAKIEYNYLDFGSHTIPYPAVNGLCPPCNVSVNETKHIVKVGVNYLFGGIGKGPVVARY